MAQGERPLHQVELQAEDAGHDTQLVADLALLGRAVHLFDAQQR